MISHVLLNIFSGPDIAIVAFALLLLFGGKKLPELMKGIGKGIKEFKDASNGVDEQHKNTPENNSNKSISSEQKT